MIERELRFTDQDMALFAAGSGDFSPLHTDHAFGRCTAYGDCIVYGGLLTIALLGSLPVDALAQIRTVRSSFPGPVLTGKTALARALQHPSRAGAWEVTLMGRGKTLARLIADTRREASRADATLARAAASESEAAERAGIPLGVGDALAAPYQSGSELHALARQFGAESLHPALLDGIGWASYIVGMGMPGFQGLCAAVDVTTAADDVPREELCARGWILVRDHDHRTQRRLVEGVLSNDSGGARTVAQIECFPVAVPPLPDPAAVGLPDTPAPLSGTVVVVGGSRGFGAALSLALLARGYAVHIVYAASSEAATGLARLAGPHADRLFLHQLDVREPGPLASLVQALRDSDTSLAGLVLNAAAPPLPMGLTGESAGELADYVADSLRLAAIPLGMLLPLLDGDRGWVVFSSAAAVKSPVRHLPHFVSAKAALEGLARWVATTTPSARVVVIRSPEMRTGVTSGEGGSNGIASAEAVAAWAVERIAGNELRPGLNILEPDAAEARSQ